MKTRADKSGAPSNTVLSILFALGERELHGYGIMKEVEERTQGRVTLLSSSLYATIKRMLQAGWIEETDDGGAVGSPGRARRLYRITDAGRELAAREARRMSALLDLARANRLGGHRAPGRGSGA
jgi:DNA-binding PadR family transcriptional regulator